MRNLLSSSTCAIPVMVAAIAVFTFADRFEERNAITAEMPAVLEELADLPEVGAEVSTFYERRDHAPAWVDGRSTAAARRAIDVIRSVRAHGLDPDEYGAEDLSAELVKMADHRPRDTNRGAQLANLDARITAALLVAGHHVALGRTAPGDVDRRWTRRRTAPDFVSALAELVRQNDIDAWLDTLRPRHPEYAALQQAIAESQIAGDTAVFTQIAVNLDRWRWMPDDLGPRHFLVNIPAYTLLAREDGQFVKDMRVVVGKRGQETPVFSGEMATVVFSPYWNVPDSIAIGETAPAAARDSEYLSRNAMEILRVTKSGTERVDPSTVDWEDTDALRHLAFRQRPGPGNALGHVKFLFPNPYSIYLHDTPSDSLFARPSRAFSHGCIRVEEPEALAQYVLRDQPEWDADRIRTAMYSGVERAVKLPSPIPVHVVYFTVWVDAAGEAQFYPDVYQHDAKQLKALTRTTKLGTKLS